MLLRTLAILLVSLPTFAQVWLPQEETPSEIVNHSAITVGYNEDHEVANWVGYVLRREHLQNCVERSNSFKEDPRLRTGSGTPEDYKSSGYDRGHLAPAGDMKWSRTAMRETFYMSNISPQTGKMNRGQWAQLEVLVRAWAKDADETIVFTGTILEGKLPRIGRTGISVPNEHYKVLLRSKNGELHAIGFLMSRNPTGTGIETYALPVRVIEGLAGLDFFPHLPEEMQDKVETQIDWNEWNFKARFSYDPCSR